MLEDDRILNIIPWFHPIPSTCIHRVGKRLDWKIEFRPWDRCVYDFLGAAFVRLSFEEGRYLFYLMHGGS